MRFSFNRALTSRVAASSVVLALSLGWMPLLHAQAWIANHGLTAAQYQAKFNDLSSKGYRLQSVSGYVSGGSVRYAALWVKSGGTAWVARHGLSPADYQKAFDDYAKQGFRLTFVNGCEVDGKNLYAAIWDKKPGPAWIARHGLSAQQYQAAVDDLTRRGYRPVFVSGYTLDGSARYAGIFEKSTSPATVARHGLTSAEYQKAFNDFGQQGFRLKVVSGYRIGNADYYAAIWEKSSGPVWIARHGVPDSWYQNVFDNYSYQGYRPTYIEAFTSDRGGKLNSIWENSNFKAADLDLISSKATQYMSSHDVPGLALAITKNGRLVYAAGFGLANKESREEVGPLNLFRIASVSKPITSVAIMKLSEAKKLSLDDKVFGPGSILGNKYSTPSGNPKLNSISVRQLLQHASGISNTVSDQTTALQSNDGKMQCPANYAFRPDNKCHLVSDPMFQNLSYNHDQLINWVLGDTSRKVNVEPGSVYEYLNFGYCLLGRVVEQRSGQTYEAYVRNTVLKPAGVTDMVIASNSVAARKPREVTYYPSSAYDLNVTRFDAHGGWLASPVDLVRFLVRVDGDPSKPDILSPASITTMTTKAGVQALSSTGLKFDPNYALGWAVSPPNHNGAMTGSLAFLVIAQNGFEYSVTANTRPANDGFGGDLSKMMQEIIAGVSAWPSYDLF